MSNYNGPIAEYLSVFGFPAEILHTGGGCYSLGVSITEDPNGPLFMLGMIDPDTGLPAEDSGLLSVECHPSPYGLEWSAEYRECHLCAEITRTCLTAEDDIEGHTDGSDIAEMLIPHLRTLARLLATGAEHN